MTNQMAATLSFSQNHNRTANNTVKMITVEVSPKRVADEKKSVLVAVKFPQIS